MTNLDYLYNPAAVKKQFTQNYFVNKKLSFEIIEHGTVLPHAIPTEALPPGKWRLGGILDAQGKFIENSSVICGEGLGYYPPPRINST